MEDVKTPAEPSAAETKNVQFTGWDDKGNPTVKKSEPTTQDSAPVEKKEPEPKGESAAEAGAAKESQEKPKDKGKLTAEERIAQLESTIQKIRESSGKVAKPAEPSAAKQDASEKKDQPPSNYQDWRKQFKPSSWVENYAKEHPEETYEDAQAAMSDYLDDVRTGFKKSEEAFQSAKQAFESKMDEVAKRYPEADAKATIKEAGTALYEAHKDSAFVVEMVNRSPVFHDLLYVLGKDPGKLAEFIQTAKSDPFKAAREVSVLEDLIMKELKKSSDDGDKGKAEVSKETPAEPKPRAPKPPSEVSGRGAAPEDALIAAARANNFRDFDAEQTRRAVASRK